MVGCATSGEDAIEQVLELRPDLVLMDINLCGRLTGLEAAEQILSHYPVCIVVVSAYEIAEFQQRAEAIGICAYLTKPLISPLLFSQLERAYTKWHEQPSAKRTDGQKRPLE